MAAALLCSWFVAPVARADKVSVQIQGLEGAMLESANANVELRQYENRDVSAAQVQRLFARADEQIRNALEPFGYYDASVQSRLEQPDPTTYRAVFEVKPGDAVIVRKAQVAVSAEAARLQSVQQAIRAFEPKVGERLDHGAYESSKQRVATALAGEGFLKARAVRHRVEVVRATKSAQIDLFFEAGERYRLGEARFSGSQFPDGFMRRFTPWKPGDYYAVEKLLELQRSLSDVDYFASVSVTPDLDHVQNGVVPVDVLLIPARRNVYSASVYVSTDLGPGVRVGFDRRWLNNKGHKLAAQMEYSTRLQEIAAQYRIPQPGPRSRLWSFGVAYRDEQTDTTTSHMTQLSAAQIAARWRGFTRTLGLLYLDGNFEVANVWSSTYLLYADASLNRTRADNLAFPLKGYSLLYGLRFSPEWALSKTSFVQARAEGKRVQRAGRNGRVIVRGSLGAMAVDNFDALPPELRFFAGGDRSIRGFAYQEIGDVNAQGGVIGGKYLAVGSVEYEHYFLPTWGMATFVDAGDAFTSSFTANVGVGAGLRWKSPVGLLRLDVAWPVVTDFEKTWRLHLVIGPDL